MGMLHLQFARIALTPFDYYFEIPIKQNTPQEKYPNPPPPPEALPANAPAQAMMEPAPTQPHAAIPGHELQNAV